MAGIRIPGHGSLLLADVPATTPAGVVHLRGAMVVTLARDLAYLLAGGAAVVVVDTITTRQERTVARIRDDRAGAAWRPGVVLPIAAALGVSVAVAAASLTASADPPDGRLEEPPLSLPAGVARADEEAWPGVGRR